MHSCETIQELRRELKAVKSGCAGDTIFGAKALLFMCEVLNRMKPPKRKYRPSAWNRFVKEGIQAGKPIKQIAAEWREKKLRVLPKSNTA